MSKGMMGTMIAATKGDGSLAFLCRNPETHMRIIRSSAIEFFADRTSHVHASNAIKVFTLGLFRAKFREALHVRAMDGACLERYEKDDVADWRLAIRTSSGSDKYIGGFERVDCTEKRAWNELVYYASLEVLIHLKEATKTALETQGERVRTTECNAKQISGGYLTEEERDNVMAHAYPAKELGHDIGVEGLESDWMRQREERRLEEMMQSVARAHESSADEEGMPPSEQRQETNGVSQPPTEPPTEPPNEPEVIPAEMDNGTFNTPEEHVDANQQ
ncbi:hypothetical protein FVE85_3840 [Porphyridium purpureum]|uniref:Uncharacterized protein n=1 Tax=Porphyridium purpureum TaxID=35688 RepID=A0A5J4YHM1_PORPP|nr:hypothetical protein FVE85_9408 [Porphyridium purpureum]KAA8490691.1 hypothetical protein FVE85_3840 [Porphyridium purpureum]|eukprot:POR8910..scf255_21